MCETTLDAPQMMAHLHAIEHELGRRRNKRWEPRVIDLDLIDYNGELWPDLDKYRHWLTLPLEQQMQQAPEQLILPHPRLQDRVFVLVPMRDIAPAWVHPVTGETLETMLSRFTPAQLAEIWPA